ncbi:hypothetical protein [Haloterrigena turkmenica]|uniref:hypothetical protein n=1 Tax=Haloterrigena turkmenica TaxID=62320 RepID=UPI000A52BBD1|nr:hypothetical protein [Haloterrigena turkmenica]
MFGDPTPSEETQSRPESDRRVRPAFLTLLAIATAAAGLLLWRRRTAAPKLEPPF